MKKFASMFLALVMALSLAVPAFAQSGTVKVDGTIQVPTINVVLPTTASLVMNPYSMDVKLNPKDTNTVNDQIISPLMTVKNLSNIDVKTNIKVTGTVGRGEAEFAAASAASETAKKSAYIYVAFEIGDATMTAVTDTNGAGGSTVVLSTTEQEVTDFADAAAAASGNTLKASADAKNPASNGVLGFQFFGDTANVTTWTDKDTLAATIAFKFTPVSNAAATPTPPATPSVTASMTGTPAASGSVTLNAAISNIDGSKNPTYSWAVTTDTNSIVDSFLDSAAASQTVNIAAGATTGQSATLTVTVTYDDTGSQDATVTDTVTITMP